LNQSNELVEIYVANGEIEAEIVKGKLESFGIQSFLRVLSAPGEYFAGIGYVSVMVTEKDKGVARELIKGENNA
jgi:hypothetical protein